jgi:hypothetical protein
MSEVQGVIAWYDSLRTDLDQKVKLRQLLLLTEIDLPFQWLVCTDNP